MKQKFEEWKLRADTNAKLRGYRITDYDLYYAHQKTFDLQIVSGIYAIAIMVALFTALITIGLLA